ncbi:hypothetical protein CPC08DRAFT_776593 [Agrocybe pediades]|nr:hypothetical protein CPC08DRAFT_776593 [Agrocybe pediades]
MYAFKLSMLFAATVALFVSTVAAQGHGVIPIDKCPKDHLQCCDTLQRAEEIAGLLGMQGIKLPANLDSLIGNGCRLLNLSPESGDLGCSSSDILCCDRAVQLPIGSVGLECSRVVFTES